MTDHATYREWSAAYVLGALEPTERRDFETHLSECESCQRSVAALAPIPGLLSRVDPPNEVAAPERIADQAVSRLRSEWSDVLRSRRRWRWAALVAAAIAVVAMALPAINAGTGDSEVVLGLAAGSMASGEVTVQDKSWGTAVAFDLTELPQREKYVAWAITDDGEWQQIAVWGPTSNGAALVSGASSIPLSEMDQIVVCSNDRSDVLLSAPTSQNG